MAHVEEIDTTQSLLTDKKKRGGPPPLVKYYLVLYNVLSTLGWAYILARTASVVFNLNPAGGPTPPAAPASALQRKIEQTLPAALAAVIRRAGGAYAAVGAQTAVVQSFAALEVLHVLLGWVRSPLATTVIQVGSRLYLVWGITYAFPETRTNPLYASMLLSWALTEVVRYAFYACALLGAPPRPLVRLRYTLFYALYPSGASSEALLIFASLPRRPAGPFLLRRALESPHVLLRGVLFLVWWPGLYVMYTHMMKQRRKVLTGPRPKFKSS